MFNTAFYVLKNVSFRFPSSKLLQLCPKFIFARCSHLTTALWASVEIPSADVHTAALGAQTSSLTVERRGNLADYSPDNNVLDCVAVATFHRYYLLLKQSATLIQLNLIAARLASQSLLS